MNCAEKRFCEPKAMSLLCRPVLFMLYYKRKRKKKKKEKERGIEKEKEREQEKEKEKEY